MDLSEHQNDALTELINIGFGRAASALSELSGHRISLEVPRITLHAVDEVVPIISQLVQGDVASVNQVFTGPISGNAILLLDERSATLLTGLLCEDGVAPGGFDAAGHEIITELGNILLNACLSVFGDLLQVRVNFAVPQFQVAAVGLVLRALVSESKPPQHGLLIHTNFHLRASNIHGYLIIVLGITSFERLLQELAAWELRQATC